MSHKSNKYERAKEEERRLKKVYKETKTRFWSGVYKDKETGRLVKYSCNRGGKTFFKKLAHKIARRSNNINTESDYHKTFDLWWTIT